MTSDNKPYGPAKYKDIVRECYFISKYLNTSYPDAQKISPIERQYLLEFIGDNLQKQKEAYDNIKTKQ